MIIIEEKDPRFYIAPSSLPNAGLGCFAKIHLEKNDWLEIIGILVKNDGIADKCTHYAKRYKFASSPKFTHKVVPMGFGGLVNHTDNQLLQNCYLNYNAGLAKKNEHASQMVYQFTKDIYPDQELLGNYGDKLKFEVQKIALSREILKQNQQEWDKFLNFNLYNLKKVQIELGI